MKTMATEITSPLFSNVMFAINDNENNSGS